MSYHRRYDAGMIGRRSCDSSNGGIRETYEIGNRREEGLAGTSRMYRAAYPRRRPYRCMRKAAATVSTQATRKVPATTSRRVWRNSSAIRLKSI